MSITISDTTPRVQYTAANTQTAFAVPFEFFTNADLKVYAGSSLLTYAATPANATQYSVSGAGVSGGGSITIGAASTNGVIYTIYRDMAVARSTDFPTSGAFQIGSLNTELDKVVAMIQQVERDLKFSPQAAATTANTFNLTFPDLVADKILSVNSSGTALEFSQSITDVATVAGIAANITTVGNIASNVTSVAGNATNINLVAGSIGSVNTVAADIAKVIAVANDLAEAVSEIETVADDLNESTSEIDVVAGAIANVNTVGGAVSNVNAVAGAITNINNLNASNVITNIGVVAGIASDVTAVKDISADIQAVEDIKANVTTVAGMSSAITTINNSASAINNVNSNASNINTVAGLSSTITAVNNNSSNINAVNTNASNINTVAGNNTNINTVAAANTNVNNVGGAITNLNTVATNLAAVNNFADQYRIASSAPQSSLTIGDLYFDTSANELKVYKSSGWAAAGSTVNGTSARYNYTATNNQTTFTGADTAGETLAYDAGFVDVYLNGVRLSAADITTTSGTSIVLATGAATGDILDIVGYGTFNVAAVNGSAINAGTINVARLPSTVLNSNIDLTNLSGTNITSGTVPNARLTGTGAITINGSAVALGGSVTVGETKPTITGISPSTIENTATDIVITGTNYGSSGIPNVEIINSNGAISYPNTIVRNSNTQLTINVTIATDASYFLRIELEDGNAVRSSTAILTVSDAPVISTSAGSLGTFAKASAISVTVAGSGDATLVWSVSGTLPTGLSLNTSTGVISGTESSSITAATTYSNIIITLTDNESQSTNKTFSITISVGATGGGQFN